MSKHSRSKTVWRVILAIVSVLVIVALGDRGRNLPPDLGFMRIRR